MENPLVSIIIPTRNRQIYASKTVHQILSLKQDIEIIVQDNSDNEDLYKDLKECIVQNKIKYEVDILENLDLSEFEKSRSNPIRVRLLHEKIQNLYERQDL